MPSIPLSIIIRHPKERLSKCSLTPLQNHPNITFYTAKPNFSFDATNHILLAVDAPPLSPQDQPYPLLLLDSTWKLLPDLEKSIHGTPIRRSLPLPPGLTTAYPRVSKIFKDPACGLASIEALYLALRILGHDDPSLLDHYYWKSNFLARVNSLL